LQESVAAPLPPRTVVGLTVHDKAVELDVALRATGAEKPFAGPTVTVELLAEPAIPVTEVGLALMLKS